MERTLVLLKPDCVERRLMGRVLARFEDKQLDIIAMKMMRITPELAKRHYAEHVQKAWYPELGVVHYRLARRGDDRRGAGSDLSRPFDGRRDQRLEGQPRHDPRRFQQQPADEPRPRLRRTGIGRPRNRDFLRRRRNPGRKTQVLLRQMLIRALQGQLPGLRLTKW